MQRTSRLSARRPRSASRTRHDTHTLRRQATLLSTPPTLHSVHNHSVSQQRGHKKLKGVMKPSPHSTTPHSTTPHSLASVSIPSPHHDPIQFSVSCDPDPFLTPTHTRSLRHSASSGSTPLIPLATRRAPQQQLASSAPLLSSLSLSSSSSATTTAATRITSTPSTSTRKTMSPSSLQITASTNKLNASYPALIPATISHSHHSMAFHPTTPSRFFSRILVLGGLSFVGYQYYQWKIGNEKYFESLDAIKSGDPASLKTADKEMVDQYQEEQRLLKERTDGLRVPILAKEFSREFIKAPDAPVDAKLRDYEVTLGKIINDFTDEEYKGEQDLIDRQYMKLLMDTMDKIVVPSSMFLNYHASYPAAHAILRLQQGCCREEIMDNYRELMRVNHPDVGGSPYLSAKITEAKELLITVAHSNPGYVNKKDHWAKRVKDRDEEEYNEQLARRLDIIQRRKEIMEFRQRQWGTPEMNREPMVVENEASRRVHSLDFGILQMNRGEWPSIPFDGWKPRVFRSADEDDRWGEYKKIRQEIKNAPLRREIEAYQQQQRTEWEMIKFEKDQFKRTKTLEQYRPEVSHRIDAELDKTPTEIKMDAFYNTTDNIISQWRQKKVDFYTLRGIFGNENQRGPFIERRMPKGRAPNFPVDPQVTHINTNRMQQHLGRAYWPNWDRTERWKVSQWEPYQRWKHHRY